MRTLPPLAVFAREVANVVGGTARLIDPDERGAAAIALGDTHPLLVRDHGWILQISLPVIRSWSVRTPAEWVAAAPEIQSALARGTAPISMSDLVLASAPALAALTCRTWAVSFPGTPVPAEAWLRDEHRSIGLFQQESSVRIVSWAGNEVQTKIVATQREIGRLDAWLALQVERQDAVFEAAKAAERSAAALPLPDYDLVVALLRSGARIQTGGGRWYETYSWADGLEREVFDEGATYEAKATAADLRRAIERYPHVFRAALAAAAPEPPDG